MRSVARGADEDVALTISASSVFHVGKTLPSNAVPSSRVVTIATRSRPSTALALRKDCCLALAKLRQKVRVIFVIALSNVTASAMSQPCPKDVTLKLIEALRLFWAVVTFWSYYTRSVAFAPG